MNALTQQLLSGTSSLPQANDKRGTRAYTEAAKALVKEFPLGTELTTDQFDAWAQRHGLLFPPPVGMPKQSDQWVAHIQRRHHLKQNLNKSSTHPRMREEGSVAFVLVSRGGLLHIRAPERAMIEGEVATKVQSILKTKRQQLRYLQESADFDALPVYERVMAEGIEDDIDLFERVVNEQAASITNKFSKLEMKIRRAVAQGNVKPRNGGLTKFLASPDPSEAPMGA